MGQVLCDHFDITCVFTSFFYYDQCHPIQVSLLEFPIDIGTLFRLLQLIAASIFTSSSTSYGEPHVKVSSRPRPFSSYYPFICLNLSMSVLYRSTICRSCSGHDLPHTVCHPTSWVCTAMPTSTIIAVLFMPSTHSGPSQSFSAGTQTSELLIRLSPRV